MTKILGLSSIQKCLIFPCRSFSTILKTPITFLNGFQKLTILPDPN